MAYDGSLSFDTRIDSSGFNKGLGELGSIAQKGLSSFNGFSLGLAKGIAGAVAAAGAAIGGVATAAVSAGMNFESQMSTVKAISGATAQEMELLTEKAKQMGIESAFSATEAGQAFEYMAMAGWKTEDMMGGVEGIMNLAAASGEDLALTADIVTDALTAFGLSASEAGRFSDVLATASSSSNTNVAVMGETFKYVAPVAGALGYSIEDTAVAIGLMANASIKGGQAGTSLRSALVRLTKIPDPSKSDAGKWLKNLGLLMEVNGNLVSSAIVNMDGSMKPLNETLQILRDSFGGLSKAEQLQAAGAVFGQEAMSGMLAIINASDEDFKNLTESINDSSGASKEMADIRLDNLRGQITLLGSSLEGLGVEFYECIAEPAKESVKQAIEIINSLTETLSNDGISAAVEQLGDIFATLISSVAQQAPLMVEGAVLLVNSFVEGLLSNREAILSGAMTAFYALVDGIREILPGIAELAAEIAPKLLEGFVVSMGLVYEIGIQTLTAIATGIAENVDTLIPATLEAINSLVSTLVENLPLILEAAAKIVIALAEGISENLPQILEAAVEVIVMLAEGIAEALPELVPTIVDIILQIVETLIDNVDKLIDAALKIILALAEGLINALPQLLAKGPEIVRKLSQALVDAAGEIVKAAWQLITALAKALIDNLPLIINAALQIMIGLGRGLIDAVGEVVSSSIEIAGNIVDTFLSIDWLDIGRNIISGIASGVSNAASSLVESVKNAASSAFESAKNFFDIKSPSRLMRDKIGAMLPPGIAEGVKSATPGMVRDVEHDMAKLAKSMQMSVTADVLQFGARFSSGAAGSYTGGKTVGTVFHITVPPGGSARDQLDARAIGKQIGVETQRELRSRGVLIT